MDEKRGIFSKDDISLLRHLIDSLEEAEIGLKQSYEKRDLDRFNKTKRLMIEIQKIISEVLDDSAEFR